MILPVQALSVARGMVASPKTNGGVSPSFFGGLISTLANTGCNYLPEPAKTICKVGGNVVGTIL